TYWTNTKCLRPAHDHQFDAQGYLQSSQPNLKWHYSPTERSFDQVLEEYIQLLTTIIKDQVGDHRVILPLSGGLDSRSQAMVLKDLENEVHSYSYYFTDGFREDRLAQQIATVCGFKFDAFAIP